MNQATARRPRVSALERSPQKPFIIDHEALHEAEGILAGRLEDQTHVVGTNQHKVSGFLRVEETGNERNPYCFTGILLPYEWEDHQDDRVLVRLRNRMFIIGKYSHEWFEPFCKEILADGTNMRLRVRVNLHNENLAFILPGARTPEHAKAEWTLAAATAKAKQPVRLFNATPEQLARRVYDHFVRINGGSVTHYVDDKKAAIAVDKFGHIYALTNGDNIEQFTGSLQRHEVIMDRDIRSCVKSQQLSSLEQLHRYTDSDYAIDANDQYRT